MNADDFIRKLNNMLPVGFEAKKYNGMPRIHIKYNHYGFAVIDLRRDSYNLYGSKECSLLSGFKDLKRFPI